MRKSTRIVKRIIALFLVVLMSINTLGAVVSDNDGSAFITKAEFDSLKNDFQSQIDQYNISIDSKIDGAIASYLSGVNMQRTKSKIVPEVFKNKQFTMLTSNELKVDVGDRAIPKYKVRIGRTTLEYGAAPNFYSARASLQWINDNNAAGTELVSIRYNNNLRKLDGFYDNTTITFEFTGISMGNGAFTVNDPTKAIALLTKLVPNNGNLMQSTTSFDLQAYIKWDVTEWNGSYSPGGFGVAWTHGSTGAWFMSLGTKRDWTTLQFKRTNIQAVPKDYVVTAAVPYTWDVMKGKFKLSDQQQGGLFIFHNGSWTTTGTGSTAGVTFSDPANDTIPDASIYTLGRHQVYSDQIISPIFTGTIDSSETTVPKKATLTAGALLGEFDADAKVSPKLETPDTNILVAFADEPFGAEWTNDGNLLPVENMTYESGGYINMTKEQLKNAKVEVKKGKELWFKWCSVDDTYEAKINFPENMEYTEE